MVTRDNRVTRGRMCARRYKRPTALPIYQPEYITLDQLLRMYKAFRYLTRRCAQHGKDLDYWYQVTDPDGHIVGRFCESFSDFVDLYTKQSKLYRVY